MDPLHIHVPEECFNLNAKWKEFYVDIVIDLPSDMPEPLGNYINVTMFVSSNHAGNVVTRCSHTGVLIFVNNAPIITFSKKQNIIESATFTSELVAMWVARDLTLALHIKLRMFGVPINAPAGFLIDNNGVMTNSSIPELTLNKKHNAINYHIVHNQLQRVFYKWQKKIQTQF
ncbi:hypothetical protein ACHAXS_000637 [Conticribra weissflogii]